MKRMLHSLVALLLITVMNLFVLGAHSSAMPASHSMPGMKSAKTSISCVTICTSASSNRLSDVDTIDTEDNEEPGKPFYVAYQQPLLGLESQHTAIAREVVRFEPPPGLPRYIQFSVFRI